MVGQLVKGVAKKVAISMRKPLVYHKTRHNCNIGLSRKHPFLTAITKFLSRFCIIPAIFASHVT